jgi:hypothetical protein
MNMKMYRNILFEAHMKYELEKKRQKKNRQKSVAGRQLSENTNISCVAWITLVSSFFSL